MNETSAGNPASPKTGGRNKVVGQYLTKIEDVPKEVREYAINRLNPTDAEGNRLKDGSGRHVTASVSTAKENGSYYGPVVLNNDKYLVQAVGKDRLYAVVHAKENVELQGSTLSMLDAKKNMGGFSVQVHYNGGKAKVFPWADKSRTAQEKPLDTPAKESAPAKDAMNPESIMAKAAEYAKQNIKNANQREAFLKHLGNVTQEAFQQPEAKQTTKQPQPQQAKADNSIER